MSGDRVLDSLLPLIDHPIVGRKGGTSRLAGMSRGQQEQHFWRMVNRTPEAVVRITGYGRGAQHALKHMYYVGEKKGREGVELETERGEVVVGKEEIKSVWRSWRLPDDPPGQAEEAGKKKRGVPRETMNIVLSMPPGTDTEKMRRAVRAFAAETFPHNQYVFGLHTDEDHPHFHLTVKMRGLHGKKINTRRGDTVKWRERFAEKLRAEGLAATATPQAVRGRVRKARRQTIWHIEDRARERRDGGKPYQRSRVMVAKEEQAVAELVRGRPDGERPWEQVIAEFQTDYRQRFLKAAALYEAQGKPEDLAKAKALRTFVADMPPIETEHQALMRERASFVRQQLGQGAQRGADGSEPQPPAPDRGRRPR